MSAEVLRRAADRLDLRCMTVAADAHPNPIEVEKWLEEWKRLAAWLRSLADDTRGVTLRVGEHRAGRELHVQVSGLGQVHTEADAARAVARAILGETP